MGFNHGAVVIAGRFKPNGSSAMDQTKTYGKGFTVLYTSTGLYTITYDDKYSFCFAFVPQLSLGTDIDTICKGNVYSASAGTQIITTWDISDAALKDVAAATDNYISFIAVMGNTSFQ